MEIDVDLRAPVVLVKGSDEVLVGEAVVELVRALVGDGDRGLMVEELSADAYDGGDGYDIAVFSGPSQFSYTIVRENGGFRITDNRNGAPDGSDFVRDVEKLKFANSEMTLTPQAAFASQFRLIAPDGFVGAVGGSGGM